MTRAGAPITSKGELPFDSDGELRRERITRSHDNREALPLDRVWKAEQIGGGKAIFQQLCRVRDLLSAKGVIRHNQA